MKKPLRMVPLTWFVVVAVALLLAFSGPRQVGVLGRLPGSVGQNVEAKVVPETLSDERVLVLVTFNRAQRVQAESWIDGMQLRHDASIAWVRMPVLNDPGDAPGRAAAQNHVLGHYATAQERANLLPLIVDRAAFVQSAGLSDAQHAYALVINRNGEVLARFAGAYDESKAQTLRDTLASNLHGL